MKIALCVCLLLLTLTSCAREEQTQVGFMGPLSGQKSQFGISVRNGLELAVREVNASGGVRGRRVRLIIEDDRGELEEVAASFDRLMSRGNVCAVIGEVTSSASLLVAAACESTKVPMITPSATSPRVTRTGRFVFKVCFGDMFQGEAIARFCASNLGFRRAAILSEKESEYSQGLAHRFKDVFSDLGGDIVAEEFFVEGDVDFQRQLLTIDGADPQILFVPGYYTEAALIARQAVESGMRLPIIGGDGWDSKELLTIGGDAVEGSYFVGHFWKGDAQEPIKRFVDAYRSRFGDEPDGFAALGYDSALILMEALQRLALRSPASFSSLSSPRGVAASALELEMARDSLRQVISETSDFAGVTGTITLDEQGNAVKPAKFFKIEGGEFRYVGVVNP
jgi:branched-chain amino acid transport system substrate-binding protein